MGKQDSAEGTVTLEELAVSNSFEIAALISVLERKGLLTREELIAEIVRLRDRTNR